MDNHQPPRPRRRAASLAGGNQELIAANKIVESLPALVEAAARGLAASNLTIFNGTEGVSQVVAGLVGQGMSILDTLKRSTAAVNGEPAARTLGADSSGQIRPVRQGTKNEDPLAPHN